MAPRNTKVQALSIGAVVLAASGSDVWASVDPGEKRRATRGNAQTITSIVAQPDDMLVITCYEEDPTNAQLLTLDNLLTTDVLGVVPTGGLLITNAVNCTWQRAILKTPGGSRGSSTPQEVTWTFALVGMVRTPVIV